jgi:LysM repeat protein
MNMSELVDRDLPSASPFIGLRPTRQTTGNLTGVARSRGVQESMRASRTLMATMPIVLVGSLAISGLGIAPLHENAKPDQRHRVPSADPELTGATVTVSKASIDQTPDGELATAAVAPATYVVRTGDTVSEIAGRFGLSTASVLALNGLGWKSLIFPGQTLRLAKVATAAPAVSAPKTVAYVAPLAPATKPAAAVPQTAGGYIIQRGDTITAIAKKLGVTVAAILGANGLSASSIIYAGRSLVIPGAATVAPAAITQPASVGGVTVPLSPTMAANARTIISVGRSLGVPDYGLVVALSAAAQESDLLNLPYGDRDSVGLFQQRPSAGWGTVAQLTSPSYAAALFFGGPRNPNKGKTRGLLDIPGWQSLTVTQAAQAVQISATPTAYAKWETSARAWLAQLG